MSDQPEILNLLENGRKYRVTDDRLGIKMCPVYADGLVESQQTKYFVRWDTGEMVEVIKIERTPGDTDPGSDFITIRSPDENQAKHLWKNW